MRSLFSRLKGSHNNNNSNINADTPQSTSRPSPSTSNKDKENRPLTSTPVSLNVPVAESSESTKPLSIDTRTFTTPPIIHSQSSSSSSGFVRPHSTLSIPVQPSQEAEVEVWEGHEGEGGVVDGDKAISASGGHAQDGVKKVTFRSPIPKPATSVVIDNIPTIPTPQPGPTERNQPFNIGRRVVSTSPAQNPQSRPPVSRSSTAQSTASSRARSSAPPTSRPSSIRKVSLPPILNTFRHNHQSPSSSSPVRSAMSPTPSDQTTGAGSTRSYLPPPNSWSEMAEEELIANLGPRERTRQEVLWEIVSSEERYVQELVKLNETFCQALLPPSATSPQLELHDPTNTLTRTLSPASPTPTSPTESLDHLPIASRYASSSRHLSGTPSESSPITSHPPPSSSARMNAYNILTNGRPSDPSHSTNPKMKTSFSSLDKPHEPTKPGQSSRSHQSLPPPSRSTSGQSTKPGQSFSSSFARMSYQSGHNKLHKGNDSRVGSGSSTSTRSTSGGFMGNGSVELPEDLETVLRVLSGGILEGHVKLAKALRKRYDDQYPLVRSLADVFTAHSYILREYASYVLHLEAALSTVDTSLSSLHLHQPPSKRHSRQPLSPFSQTLLSLEELASQKGESGLIISLSKPFQRLLKYPLLFQNLLFNTDPSMKEYEATLSMVDEVEEIVRMIEDEKSDWEVREGTRDVWARIEGLEGDKGLMTPKANRILIGETQLPQEQDGGKANMGSIKQKKSFKRLSDILKGNGGPADLWIVRFTDVSLVCERTGLTQLPFSSTKKGMGGNRSDSLPELSGKSKSAGRRVGSVKARNLYKFVRVYEWHLKQKSGSTEGLLTMDDVSRSRAQPVPSSAQDTPDIASDTAANTPILASPLTTPRKPLRVPLKTIDGGSSPSRTTPRARKTPSSNPTTPSRDDDTDTITSDRLSVMSFAFHGSDQIKPKPRPRPLSTNPTKQNNTPTSPKSGVQRRGSNGHVVGTAAIAKFAHRLRTPHEEGEEGDVTIRPSSRVRRSLPPAMLADGKVAKSASGRVTPMSGATRPAWNAGTGSAPRSPTTTVRARPGSAMGGKRGSVGVARKTGVEDPEEGKGPAGLDVNMGDWSAFQEEGPSASEVGRSRAVITPIKALERGGRI